MADLGSLAALRNYINQQITDNNNYEIDGPKTNQVLQNIADTLNGLILAPEVTASENVSYNNEILTNVKLALDYFLVHTGNTDLHTPGNTPYQIAPADFTEDEENGTWTKDLVYSKNPDTIIWGMLDANGKSVNPSNYDVQVVTGGLQVILYFEPTINLSFNVI